MRRVDDYLCLCLTTALLVVCQCTCGLFAQQITAPLHTATPHQNPPDLSIIPQAHWDRIDGSVTRGLDYLTKQQRPNGSFPAPDSGNPAITSLGVMAFLSRGHRPGEGRYGEVLDKAVRYVLNCQQPDGVFSALPINLNDHASHGPAQTGVYNTTISGLMLGELYGMSSPRVAGEIQAALVRTLDFMARHQQRSQAFEVNLGGVRYLHRHNTGIDADLSVTAWHVMLMRSAINAGFDVPQNQADQSISYVRRCYVNTSGQFSYTVNEPFKVGRGMAGAGILCLFLTGQYDAEMEARAGDYLLAESFSPYNVPNGQRDHYHYSAYYVSQAMFQLGGRYWEEFYPPFSKVLVEGQRHDGSWDAEASRHREFGNAYTTALAILALTTPDQLLPLYQR
ncbi:prenyltransferase/squalene oxidase repeat-containing protein [Lacunimicrobium album]